MSSEKQRAFTAVIPVRADRLLRFARMLSPRRLFRPARTTRCRTVRRTVLRRSCPREFDSRLQSVKIKNGLRLEPIFHFPGGDGATPSIITKKGKWISLAKQVLSLAWPQFPSSSAFCLFNAPIISPKLGLPLIIH